MSVKILKKSELKRFWKKVDKSGDCWIWTAGLVRGYGQFGLSAKEGVSKMVYAHRYSYELHFEEIPEGVDVLHTCDIPACVKPEHLFLGTHQANMSDRDNKNRQAKGSTHGLSKLDEEIARCIRRYYPLFTMTQLAIFFNVDPSTIHRVVNYKTWKHI